MCMCTCCRGCSSFDKAVCVHKAHFLLFLFSTLKVAKTQVSAQCVTVPYRSPCTPVVLTVSSRGRPASPAVSLWCTWLTIIFSVQFTVQLPYTGDTAGIFNALRDHFYALITHFTQLNCHHIYVKIWSSAHVPHTARLGLHTGVTV